MHLRVSRSLEAAARHQRRRTRSRRRHTSHPLQRSPPLHCKSIPAHRDEQHCTVGAQQNNKIKARCLLRRLTMFLLSWNYVGLSIEEHCRAASGVSTTIASSAAGTVCASADSDGEHAVVAHASLRGGRVTKWSRPAPRAHCCVHESAVATRVATDGSDATGTSPQLKHGWVSLVRRNVGWVAADLLPRAPLASTQHTQPGRLFRHRAARELRKGGQS